MIRTRRAFLRDMSLATLASASAFPSLAQPLPAPVIASGVRVFFAGAWMFCANPANHGATMFAISLEPSTIYPQDSPHWFPYGVWPNISDNYDPKARQFKITAGGDTNHITVGAGSSVTNPKGVTALFADANLNSLFPYFAPPNGSKGFPPNLNSHGVVAIELPLPTRLLPIVFHTQAYILDQTGMLTWNVNSVDTGIPTVNVLDYQGVSSLNITLAGQAATDLTVTATADTRADLHIRSGPTGTPLCDHASRMHGYLLDVFGIDSTKNFFMPSGTNDVRMGNYVPGTFLIGELDYDPTMDDDCPRTNNAKKMSKGKMTPGAKPIHPLRPMVKLPTCDSGGGGVDCPPPGC